MKNTLGHKALGYFYIYNHCMPEAASVNRMSRWPELTGATHGLPTSKTMADT